MDYYVYKYDQNIGPLPEAEVTNGLRNGRYLSDDLACRVGESEWKELSFLFPLETSAPASSQKQTAYQNSNQPNYHQPSIIHQAMQNSNNATSDVSRLMYFEANKKSVGVAYLLWLFFGFFGAHRFYLGATGSGAAQLIIFLGSIFLFVVGIGFLTIWITIIWVLIDVFLIPQIARQYNNRLLAQANAFR